MGIDINARMVVLDQAEAARATLLSVYDLASQMMAREPLSPEQINQWETAQNEAKPVLDRFQSTVSSLRQDRLARRTAQALFDATIMHWWDRCNDAADVEAQAWRFPERLTERRCLRRAPRLIHRYLDAVAHGCLHGHSADIDHFVACRKNSPNNTGDVISRSGGHFVVLLWVRTGRFLVLAMRLKARDSVMSC